MGEEMKTELDEKLCAYYPLFFRNRHGDMRTTAMCWGFDCRDGWYKYYDKPEDDLGKKYFTSNEYVKENFSRFDYEIVATFDNKKDALKFEGQLMRETQSDLQINYDRIRKLKRI